MYPFYPTDPTEKSVIYLSFTLEIPVFWHFLYRVHLVWDLRFGFLASLDITWHGTRLKKYLQFWSCHHLLSWWSANVINGCLLSTAAEEEGGLQRHCNFSFLSSIGEKLCSILSLSRGGTTPQKSTFKSPVSFLIELVEILQTLVSEHH